MIRGWQKTSLIDYGDYITSIFFYGGCNLRCPYCHNRDLVLHPDTLPLIDTLKALQYLQTKQKMYDGVCFSGGEPTLHASLPETIRAVKNMGFKVKLDTNGAKVDVVAALLDEHLVDYVALDIKTSFAKYPALMAPGLSVDVVGSVRKTIDLVKKGGVDYEFRSTVYPPFFAESDLPDLAEMVSGARRYYLQPFNPTVTLADTQHVLPFSGEKMNAIQSFFEPFVERCEIR